MDETLQELPPPLPPTLPSQTPQPPLLPLWPLLTRQDLFPPVESLRKNLFPHYNLGGIIFSPTRILEEETFLPLESRRKKRFPH